MAVVSTEKDAPQIGVPVGSRERVEALGVPTRNIATCSAHTPDNRGCPMWAICDRAFKGDRPHNQIVRRISSSGGLRVYHAPCFDIVGKEETANDNDELYEVIGGEGDSYEGRGSVKKHPKRDPNCNDCSQGKCEAWVDVENAEFTCPQFPDPETHRELVRFARKKVARMGSAVKQKAAIKARLLGGVEEPEDTDEPDTKKGGKSGSRA